MSWEKVNFLDVVKDITGGNRKFQGSEYKSEGLYPIIDQGVTLIGGYTDVNEIVNRTKEVVVFGDHTKALKFVDFDFCLGADGVKILQPDDMLDSKFLYYYLGMIHLPDVGYSRHYKFLKEINIPLPPLHIQKKIADILDKADALRKKDQQLLQKYDELAQAIFIDMFGDPVKNEKGWEVKKLGDICEINSGSTPSRKNATYFEGNIPWVKTTEVKGVLINETEENISVEGLANSSCKLNPVNSIIVAMYGQGKTRGNVGLLGIEATTNQACGVLRPNVEYNSLFVFSTLKMMYGELRKLGRGGNQENLNLDILKKFEIFFPPKKNQEEFVQKIELFNTISNTFPNKTSESLFQSLLQQAFKGELIA